MGRQMPAGDLRELLIESRESPHWDEVASRCLTCGNCTMACPTCFCTSVEDVTDLTGEHAERWMNWASCFEFDFTFVHEGSVRQIGAVAIPALDHPQARHLARSVRQLRMRGLRTVYRLVPHRNRHHRRDEHLGQPRGAKR